MEIILEALDWLPRELYIFVISLLPLIELRGAVPVGAALDMHPVTNFIFAILGNMLPIPFILMFIPRILDFLARFKIFRPVVRWLRKKADKHSKRIIREEHVPGGSSEPREEGTEGSADSEKQPLQDEKHTIKAVGAFSALMFFVALPVPGTGAWSGALVAALFDLPKKSSLLSIFLGVLICGVIMSLASYGVLGFLSFLL